ncbi:MAG TPA: glutaredoxin family protein [bacterium]|nr:glutaredoxin family protein [bacterium]
MLTVYSTSWCPHSKKTIRYLMENHVDFIYRDIERQPEETVRKVIDANGGRDWVVPTLEYNGRWRRGKAFDTEELWSDLKGMGVI